MWDANTNHHVKDDLPDYVPRPEAEASRIYGLMSAVGGTGVSTIAIQMANSLAKRDPAAKTALLSLDFENNSFAHQLHLKPKIPIEYFMQSPSRLDEDSCQAWMCQTPYGFDVLALPSTVDGNQRVNPDMVVKFMDLISRQYKTLVLDIPRMWTPWTHASLGAADKIAMVCDLNIPSLHMTREKYAALVKSVDFLGGFEIIMNKYEKKAFRNAINLTDAQKLFLNTPLRTITHQGNIVRDALNRGEPVGHSYSSSKVAKDIELILDDWVLPVTSEIKAA